MKKHQLALILIASAAGVIATAWSQTSKPATSRGAGTPAKAAATAKAATITATALSTGARGKRIGP